MEIKKFFFLLFVCATINSSFVFPGLLQQDWDITHVEIVSIDYDLQLDGTTPIYLNLTKDIDYLTRIKWILHFSATTYDTDSFADSTALTNGFDVFYNNVSLYNGKTIKTNDDILEWGCDSWVYLDDQTPKTAQVMSMQTFVTCYGRHLLVTDSTDLQILIQDNITAITEILQISLLVSGYKYLYRSYRGMEYQTVLGSNLDRDYIDEVGDFTQENQNQLVLMFSSIVGVLLMVVIYWRKKG